MHKISTQGFLKSDQDDRVQPVIQFLCSGKPVSVRVLYVGNTCHCLISARQCLRVGGGQSLGKVVGFLEMAEGFDLGFIPSVIVTWKPATKTAEEAAHKSGKGMANKKNHTIVARYVAESSGVLMQNDAISVRERAKRLGDRGSAGLADVEKVNRCLTHPAESETQLESIFQSELDRSGTMGVDRMQKRISCNTVRARYYAVHRRTLKSGGIVWATITADCVAAGVAQVRVIQSKLRVVENVEGLRAEFQIAAFRNRKVFQQTHVEVYSMRIVKKVAACIPKRETTRCHEYVRISQQGPEAARVESVIRRRTAIRVYVGVRGSPDAIRHTGVIEHRDRTAAPVNYAERCARLEDGDSGKLPAVGQRAEKARRRRRQWLVLTVRRWLTSTSGCPSLHFLAQSG